MQKSGFRNSSHTPSLVAALIQGAAGGGGGFLLPFGLGLLVTATGTYAVGFVLFAVVAGFAAVTVVRRQQAWRAHWDLEVAV